MANTKPSIFNMTPADFAVLFVTVPAVQDALVHLETEVTEYLKSFHGGQNSKLKSTEKHQEALDLAKKYREKIERFLMLLRKRSIWLRARRVRAASSHTWVGPAAYS